MLKLKQLKQLKFRLRHENMGDAACFAHGEGAGGREARVLPVGREACHS